VWTGTSMDDVAGAAGGATKVEFGAMDGIPADFMLELTRTCVADCLIQVSSRSFPFQLFLIQSAGNSRTGSLVDGGVNRADLLLVVSTTSVESDMAPVVEGGSGSDERN